MATDSPRVLIIDDEEKICRSCLKILSKTAVHAEYALNGYEALKMMERTPYDVVVTDLKMSRLGGMEVLRRLKDAFPDTMVIVITGYASVSSAVEVMKLGAFDYLPKPFTPDELRAVVRQALEEAKIRLQGRKLMRDGGKARAISHQLIGQSPEIGKVIRMIQKVAPTDSTVLISGESGTGKELVARALHVNSKRKGEVFFAVDCGTLTGNLLESELFGYSRGAFTGAVKDKVGIFQRANRGTVFLDEIGNIPLEVQGKLLRFLESREFLPLGSTTPQQVDVRLIFATNQDLEEMVKAGAFREDFYYRIFVYPIAIPRLSERKTDIPLIAYHFLRQLNRDLGKHINGFEDAALGRLASYEWPGNVRQLRNVIERAVILCDREQIGFRELPILGEIDGPVERVPSTNEELKRIKKEIRRQAVAEVEKRFVLDALMKNNWNVTRAAEKVGLQRTNFQALMKRHGIRRPSEDAES